MSKCLLRLLLSLKQCSVLILFSSFSDLLHCSNPDFNCSENYLYKDCRQLGNSKFQNYGCTDIESFKEYFQCANRMDKRDTLFQRSPMSKGKTAEGTFYNTALSFDDFNIYCGQRNFSFEEFYEVRKQFGQDDCELANGKRIQIQELWSNLLIDFSFKKAQKMNDL